MRHTLAHVLDILEDDLAHLVGVIAGGMTFGAILAAAWWSIWALTMMLR
jgi:hypothetical protein